LGNLIYGWNDYTGYECVCCNVCGKHIGELETDILNGKLPKIPKKIKFGGYEVDSYERPSMKKYNFWHIGTMAVCNFCKKKGGLEKFRDMNRKSCHSDCEINKVCQGKRSNYMWKNGVKC
jgi:hypothetical protein